VIKIRYALGSGETGEAEVSGDTKWTFGRGENESVSIDDGRISRSALTIRDSGPGPVVFRGQRGGARVLIAGPEGPVRELPEGTATNLTPDARQVELWLEGQLVLRADVEFEERGSVRDRQEDGGEA
jgi:hypothetical protein